MASRFLLDDGDRLTYLSSVMTRMETPVIRQSVLRGCNHLAFKSIVSLGMARSRTQSCLVAICCNRRSLILARSDIFFIDRLLLQRVVLQIEWMWCLLLAQLSGDGLVGVVWVLGVYESLLVAGRDDCATLLIEFVLHLSSLSIINLS